MIWTMEDKNITDVIVLRKINPLQFSVLRLEFTKEKPCMVLRVLGWKFAKVG